MAHGHACNLEMAHTASWQVLANLARQVALHDLAVVQVHLHFDVGRADVLNNLVRLRLVVQEEARNVTGVDGFNQHITARFFGFSGGPRDVLNVGFF